MPKELVFDASQLSATVTCEKCGVSVTIGPLTASSTRPGGLRCAGCEDNGIRNAVWIRPFLEFVDAVKGKNVRLRVPLD